MFGNSDSQHLRKISMRTKDGAMRHNKNGVHAPSLTAKSSDGISWIEFQMIKAAIARCATRLVIDEMKATFRIVGGQISFLSNVQAQLPLPGEPGVGTRKAKELDQSSKLSGGQRLAEAYC